MKKPLWQPGPERIEKTNMTRFMKLVNERFGKNYTAYDELYDWSVQNAPEFWGLMWEFGEIKSSKLYDEVVTNFSDMFNSEWFKGARLNFAENLLRYKDDRTALIFKGEAQDTQKTSYKELYAQVEIGRAHV